MITGRSTECNDPTTNETVMKQAPCTTSLNKNTSVPLQTDNVEAFTCSPPNNEMLDDSPARARQRRAYQAIMRSGRLRPICDLVGVLK